MNKIIIWAESEAEALEFFSLFKSDMDFIVEKIYVAKRSSGKRDVGHKYRQGEYFVYDHESRKVEDNSITAPDSITELVQWCSQDIIITDNSFKPILVIETTYHILTYNNIAQRIPRIVRGSSKSVPTVIFQKIDKKASDLISWFTKSLSNAEEIYGTACLALMFDDYDFEEARLLLIALLNKLVNGLPVKTEISKIHSMMDFYNKQYDEGILINGKKGKGRTWLKVNENTVKVIIGVRDNCALSKIKNYGCQGNHKDQVDFRKNLKYRSLGAKGCVWLSKGTGGMDPYPGLIKMSELLFCYKEGKKVKKLEVEFSKLPADFWWFKKNENEIYYYLVNLFADKVTYADSYKE